MHLDDNNGLPILSFWQFIIGVSLEYIVKLITTGL